MMPAEYRVVCRHFPKAGHGTHVHLKRTLDKALQSVLDADHHAEMLKGTSPRHWYVDEAPHRVQVREVTTWVDHQLELFMHPECQGHESTDGPAGISTYCDGSCNREGDT